MTSTDYSITEHIPVADHVYKFLLVKCGSDSFTATRNHFIGQIVLNSLGKHNDMQEPKTQYSKQVNVTIRERAYLRNGVFVGVKSGHVFNNMIDQMFRQELFSHLLVAKDYGKEQFMQSMRNFLEVYNITEDDIKFETLYRDFKRKKDSVFTT